LIAFSARVEQHTSVLLGMQCIGAASDQAIDQPPSTSNPCPETNGASSEARNATTFCIRYAFPSGAIFGWEFTKAGEAIQVDVDGPLALDSQELMVDAAAQGVGLAYEWEDRAAPYIADGRLRYCLEDWCTTEENLFLYFPSRKHQSAGLRALIEAIRA
jgi:DNA-binding transcriptional LysR family regulator